YCYKSKERNVVARRSLVECRCFSDVSRPRPMKQFPPSKWGLLTLRVRCRSVSIRRFAATRPSLATTQKFLHGPNVGIIVGGVTVAVGVFVMVGVSVGSGVNEGVRVQSGVRVGPGVEVGIGVREGVAVGGRTGVGVRSASAGY